MTKHKTPEERVEEILDAAAEVIDQEGYAKLTMERIIARTTLSKGGVYRFFHNKRDVALALISRIFDHWTLIDVDEVVGWNLPLMETIVRLFFPKDWPDEKEMQQRRIWLEILPDTLRDEEFGAERNRQRARGSEQYRQLVKRIMERDQLTVPEEMEQLLERMITVGEVFFEGLLLTSLIGDNSENLKQQAREFILAMVNSKVPLHEGLAATG